MAGENDAGGQSPGYYFFADFFFEVFLAFFAALRFFAIQCSPPFFHEIVHVRRIVSKEIFNVKCFDDGSSDIFLNFNSAIERSSLA